MKKNFLLFLFFLLAITFSNGQPTLIQRDPNDYKEKFTDRLFYGGSIGLQFGSQTFVEVAPIIGYRVTDRLGVGLGIKYSYYKITDPYLEYSTSMYGGGPFLRYFVFDGLFAHAEYEILNMEVPDYFLQRYVRKNISSVFLGGGYRQMMGARSAIDFLILFNVNDTNDSPYENPIIRIGFGFGL